LTDRGIRDVCRNAEDLTEQIYRFTNMPVHESDSSCRFIQLERCIFFINLVQSEMSGESVLPQDF
jgi:hypothetical protein